MRALSISLRLVIIVVLLAIPIGILVNLLSSEQAKAIEFAQAERRGVEYHASARALLEALIEHRTVGARYLAGGGSNRDALVQSQSEVDAAFARLAEIDARLGGEMRTTPLLENLQKAWSDLKPRVISMGTLDLPLYLTQHNQLVYDHIRLINKMGNHSNLILDPDIDTYYLMDASQFKLPGLLDQAGQAQALGVVIIELYAPSADRIPPEQAEAVRELVSASRVQLEGALIRGRSYLDEGASNLEYAYAANSRLRSALAATMGTLNQDFADVAELARGKLTRSPQVDAAAWLKQTDRAMGSGLTVLDAALINLDEGLGARIETMESARNRALGLAGGAVLLALVFVTVISRSITAPLRALTDAAERVSKGDLSATVDQSGADEVAALAQQFNRMRESIRLAAEQLGGGL